MQKIFRKIEKQIIFERRTILRSPAHIHDDIELIYVQKGSGTAHCDGKKYRLTEQSFFLVFPNQVHHYSDCTEGEYIVLVVKPSALLSYGSVFEGGVPVSALWHAGEADDTIVSLIHTAITEFISDGYSTIIQAYLTALFGKLLNIYKIEQNRTAHETVLQILQYCAAHYKENITVSSVAETLHISRSSVSHIFSSRICMNFCDYINSLRLSDAVQLLKNKNYSVTEISYISGFSTIRTFNRAFFKRYGVSPSAYKAHPETQS